MRNSTGRQHRLDPAQLVALLGAEVFPPATDRFPLLDRVVEQRGRDEQVHGEWRRRERPDGVDLVPQRIGEIADPAQATHPARLADGGNERGLRDARHAG